MTLKNVPKNTKLPDWKLLYQKIAVVAEQLQRKLARTELLLREEKRKTVRLEAENQHLKGILRRPVE